MELSKSYEAADSESKWYAQWLEHKLFSSQPDDREPFTIVIPPPNVTGELHVGHVLNNTIQDIFIRKARMQGKNACWVPGTDHASIATEARVTAHLKSLGIEKADLSREEFLAHAFAWKEKYGGIILSQLKMMGASCDWDRVNFTMDEHYYKGVIKSFVELYDKGYIYRGTKLINWDPQALTALSDEEVYFKEVNSKLYYVNYLLKDNQNEFLTVATTRPETIFGDTALCVNPEDERYKHLIGKSAYVPIINRQIPIISDDYIEIGFGTGVLKVTPAHDKNDYALGEKHKLRSINILNPNGTLNSEGKHYSGKDRFIVRKEIAKELESLGMLNKTEDIQNSNGYSERTHVVVEQRLSPQWFCDMKKMAGPALEAVDNGSIRLHPAKFANTYRHWMENIRDWCISRQLTWGQQIPAWYLADGQIVVAETAEVALEKAKRLNNNSTISIDDLRRDPDVLDTWFSSWLWPIEVFEGISNPGNADINYYYPTQVLVTAPEIIFFWVARMIMSGYEFLQEKPFEDVYFTGIVRDELGRKYSKSLGNSPDILKLMEKYGADSLRFGILIAAPAGSDTLFKESLCDQGRHFINKIWNALKLIKMWEDGGKIAETGDSAQVEPIRWFENTFQKKLEEIERFYADFNLSEVLTNIYSLIWDDFCGSYLEMIKPYNEDKIAVSTYQATIRFFEELLKLLHPFMPFITEEIWHQLKDRAEIDFCTIAHYPVYSGYDEPYLRESEKITDLIAKVRTMRNEGGISPKVPFKLYIQAENSQPYRDWEKQIRQLINITEVEYNGYNEGNFRRLIIKGDEVIIPFEEEIDVESEIRTLNEELEYTRGFLESVNKKLSNERFVQNAKSEILEKERQKKSDAEEKIKAIEDSLKRLN